MKAAVIAGTPVDTQMGVDALKAHGVDAFGYPAGKDPKDQTRLQAMPQEERDALIREIIRKIKGDGIDRIMVYCNSLSSSIDFPRVSDEEGIPIVTPMDVYKQLAGSYRLLGVMAGNNQGAAGIERTIVNASPGTIVIGFASLSVVEAVEAVMEPDEIIESRGLEYLLKMYEQSGAEAVVLGCTHFPYFKSALEARTTLPVIDPADEMYRLLTELR